MGIIGHSVKTFAEANIALLSTMPPTEMDYPHRIFAVIRAERGRVFLASAGKAALLPIKRDHNGVEYVEVAQRSAWERGAGLAPCVFRVQPYKGRDV